jgi:TolB-like protein
MNFDFAPFTLSTDRAELVGPEGVIALEPKAFAVLRLLVENHARVVSREEMIEVVWGGRFISDAAVSTALKLARRALGDGGTTQSYIKTLHGVGHRFVAPVQWRAVATVAVPLVLEAAEPSGQRPTIAVLPFWQNPDDRVQTGDGLADEIVSALSRLRWLRVIASESTFRFRQDAVDMAGLRSVLGAGYVLKGRVDLAGNRLRVLVTLIETKGGSVVWSDHLTSALDDIHQSRHDIVAAVIGAMDLQISQVEAAAARTRPSEMLDA